MPSPAGIVYNEGNHSQRVFPAEEALSVLDIKVLRSEPERVRSALEKRGATVALAPFLDLDGRRREKLFTVEQLKNRRNVVSKEIGRQKQSGGDSRALVKEMAAAGAEIKQLDDEVRALEEELRQALLLIPNLPRASVPAGLDESANVEVRRWGIPRHFEFTPKPHWELGEALGILDFERGAKVSGARFTFLKGLGARLERALIDFMLEIHSTRGYQEIFPPFLVNRQSMTGTGQLPKFEEDMFACTPGEYFLIPTAEVPVTNLHAGEILDQADLPLRYAAYSACFRAEAGAAGRDTRGLVRQHQFNKVELVKFTRPEDSGEEHERLVADAEEVLRRLGLPYRVMLLCAGDMGFSAAMCYDLEVWLPSSGRYREISSCSNFEDFQARRAEIKFRRAPGAKPEYVHTLNGSGLAVGRTLAAIIENCQQADGTVIVPELLRERMRVERIG